MGAYQSPIQHDPPSPDQDGVSAFTRSHRLFIHSMNSEYFFIAQDPLSGPAAVRTIAFGDS